MKWWSSWVGLGFAALFLLILSPAPGSAQTTVFSDVKGHWASENITWAVDGNIVVGYPDGTFRPDNLVTEAEFLVMLLRAYPDITLPDLGTDKPWYEKYYGVAEQYNWPLLHDIEGKRFNRGSAAHLLAATQGHNLSMMDAVQYLLDHNMASGKTSATLSGFGIQDKLKRAEALTLIRNMHRSGLQLVQATGSIIPVSDREFQVRGISIGDYELNVIAQLGQPARKDLSEYGFYWYIYNKDYANYIQVGMHKGRVVGLYSNVDNWSSQSGIRIGSSSSKVIEAYGTGLDHIEKGNIRYLLANSKDESPKYLIDDSYVNIFLDQHNSNTVTAIQIIEQSVEMSLNSFFGVPSEGLRKSYERQVFDLSNSVRTRFGKKAFVWDDLIANTARKHSKDMADNGYFAHQNLSGKSPFERMDDDGIHYRAAAENIAAGQTSAIFAHEGWMNSIGHRNNILADIEKLGVGVHFGGSYETYYTQNFYTPS
jgi:uncharacterized protein YkwD